jgi:hypothetical protein
MTERNEPFQWSDHKGLSHESSGIGFQVSVPAGKRLVIEMVTASAELAPGQRPTTFSVQTIAGGTSATHFLPLAQVGHDGIWASAHQVRLYADPGTQVSIALSRRPADLGASLRVSLSGVLETVTD